MGEKYPVMVKLLNGLLKAAGIKCHHSALVMYGIYG